MTPFYDEHGSTIIHGDCLAVLPEFAADRFDTVITDPPYHLTTGKNGGSGPASLNVKSPAGRSRISTGFMGKSWDGGDVAFRPETWAAVLRVCKPGAMLLAFGGDRTHHRLMCAIEDAGWEIRTTMAWIFGQGFPKSLDISRAIDKAAGAEREIVGSRPWSNAKMDAGQGISGLKQSGSFAGKYESERVNVPLTAPATADAAKWQGWGTALKPAMEIIIVAMKPLAGKTFAENALTHGVAGLNIDGSRIQLNGDYKCGANGRPSQTGLGDNYDATAANQHSEIGRWPANVLLTHHPDCKCVGVKAVRKNGHHPASRGAGGVSTSGHSGQAELVERADRTESVEAWECVEGCPVRMLDEQTGTLTSGQPAGIKAGGKLNCYGTFAGGIPVTGFGDSGGASRFFYTAKASKSDRGAGNDHPTVKPTDLLKYLCTLTATPTGGEILDPFGGSMTTLVAARECGRKAVAIELEESHCAIGVKRLAQGTLFGASST